MPLPYGRHAGRETQELLVGQRVTEVRYATEQELELAGFDTYRTSLILVFENGVKIVPSQDDEGNGVGTFFGEFEGNSLSFR